MDGDDTYIKMNNKPNDGQGGIVTAGRRLKEKLIQNICGYCYVPFNAMRQRKRCIDCQDTSQRAFRIKMVKEKGKDFFLRIK